MKPRFYGRGENHTAVDYDPWTSILPVEKPQSDPWEGETELKAWERRSPERRGSDGDEVCWRGAVVVQWSFWKYGETARNRGRRSGQLSH